MCKAFSASIGNVGLLWFNKLLEGSISSYAKFERSFNTRFMTSNEQAKGLDALSSMKMLPNELIGQYNKQYWLLFNQIPRVDHYWDV